jgi:hypothetical protein
MRFFERDSGVTTFPYGTVFDQTQARFIGVMLELEMPAAPREVMATYTCERVAPSGTKWQPEVARVRVQSGWTRVTWTTCMRGTTSRAAVTSIGRRP